MGLHLKILRKKLGITLESLAASSGMTKSYLSKVERGLNTPSIAAALKIAKALNVNVEYLFSDATSPTEAYSLIRENQRKLVPSSAKATSYALLAHPPHDRNLLPFIVFPPSQFSNSTFKEHVGEEFLFVHEGSIEIDFMIEQVILEQGDALYFNAQKPHRIRSVSEPLAKLLVVIYSGENEDGNGEV